MRDKDPEPLLPTPPALIDHETLPPLVFTARKFHVLLFTLVLVLMMYTSFTRSAQGPLVVIRKFDPKSIRRALSVLLFDLNQHVNAEMLPDEVLGKTTYDAPAAFRAPPLNVKLPPTPPSG
jgi:hypothetical protein